MSTPPAHTDQQQEPRPPLPVSIHVAGNVWPAGDLAVASGDTWQDGLATILADLATQLRAGQDPAGADLVDEQLVGTHQVNIHVGGNRWHGGDLTDTTPATWRNDLAGLLGEISTRMQSGEG